MKKRGQAWGFDLIIATVLFSAAIIAFYLYSFNYNNENTSISSDLEAEARLIASSLLSSGNPENWTESSVTRIGLTTSNKLNETKLIQYQNLLESDYGRAKSLLNAKRDFYILFSEPISINDESVESIGLPPEEHDNLIKIERITNYKGQTITFFVEVWE
ncbi:MAG: hypothetical protein AABW79_03685 [Nanoarchaeota archaeon]